ncbi:mitochondrial dicarboxylate carrier [Rhypophila decipiens]|uniref:Mitochondrial dicarboxylate carrier n=1 Tax=Rhypophila decipiens TaxID=261697 RepID=A0AAN6YDA6_9PEZI|nr:mitochondrial dicarboxylate carrier [Rhypophila decipiens]
MEAVKTPHQSPQSQAPGAAISKPPAIMEKTKVAKQHAPQNKQTIHYPFWFGGSASSMAACVRLQTRTGDMPKSMSGTFVHIVKNNGARGLYNGLSASLLRQLTYSTTRFGIYEELKDRFTTENKAPSFGLLVAMASASGFVGGFAGNPADVLNVRMQQDAALPPSQRRNYTHALDGLVKMTKLEGFSSWYRGIWPNSIRAAAMTAGQLASYDMCKRLLIRMTPMEDNLATHFTSSFMAGVAAATITSPIDVIKTRVMSASGKSSMPKLLGEIYAAEGLRWMFKGWVPSFLRLGPQTIATFLFLESHRKLYRKMNGIEDKKLE